MNGQVHIVVPRDIFVLYEWNTKAWTIRGTLIGPMILVLPLCLFYIKNYIPLVPFSRKEYIELGISTCYWSCHAFQKVLQMTTKPLVSYNDSGMSVSYFDQREMLGGTFHSLSKKNQMERLNELLCCKVQSIVTEVQLLAWLHVPSCLATCDSPCRVLTWLEFIVHKQNGANLKQCHIIQNADN